MKIWKWVFFQFCSKIKWNFECKQLVWSIFEAWKLYFHGVQNILTRSKFLRARMLTKVTSVLISFFKLFIVIFTSFFELMWFRFGCRSSSFWSPNPTPRSLSKLQDTTEQSSITGGCLTLKPIARFG